MKRYGTSSTRADTAFSFPLTKAVLWDHTPKGATINLHLTNSRNPQVYLDTLVVQLAQKYALDSDSDPFICTLTGSLIPDPDGEGLQVHIDRFDPDWDDSGMGASHNNSVSLIPGDIAIPCLVWRNDDHQNPTPVADYVATLRYLQQRLPLGDRVELHSYLSLKAMCVLTRAGAVRVEMDLVTMATRLSAAPVASVPLVATPLCKNLLSPLNVGELQGEARMGYLSMDHTRKLVTLTDSDPKAQNMPLVGIWVTGVEYVHDPFVWSACLKYLYNCTLKDRVCLPPEPFMLVLFTPLQTKPEFYDVVTDSGNNMLAQYQLNAAAELVDAGMGSGRPDVMGTSRRSVEFDVCRVESGPKMEAFSSATEQLTSVPERENPRKLPLVDVELVPRTSPSPHQIKRPMVPPNQHQVPEVSLLGEESFKKATEPARSPMSYYDLKANSKGKENATPKELMIIQPAIEAVYKLSNREKKRKSSREQQPIPAHYPGANTAPRLLPNHARAHSPAPTFPSRYQSPPGYHPRAYHDHAVMYHVTSPPMYYTYPPPPRPQYYGQQYARLPAMPPHGYYTSPPQQLLYRPMMPRRARLASPCALVQSPQQGPVSALQAVATPPPLSSAHESVDAAPSCPPPVAPVDSRAPALQTYTISQNGTTTTLTTTPDVYQLIMLQDAQLKQLQQQLQKLLDIQSKEKELDVNCRREVAHDTKQITNERTEVEILAEQVEKATIAVNTSLLWAAPVVVQTNSRTSSQCSGTNTDDSTPDSSSNKSDQSQTTDAKAIDYLDLLQKQIVDQTREYDAQSRASSEGKDANNGERANSEFVLTASIAPADRSTSSNTDSLVFSLHMTTLNEQSLDTTSVSHIDVDMPEYSDEYAGPRGVDDSPIIESVSMYDGEQSQRRRPTMAKAAGQDCLQQQLRMLDAGVAVGGQEQDDDEATSGDEDSDEHGMVSDQFMYYEKLIDNIQHLLDGGDRPPTNISQSAPSEIETSRDDSGTMPANQLPVRDAARQTLEQLRQLTMDLKSEEDVNVNRSLCEMEAAVLQQINYVSMMFEDSGDTDLSMEVNALAMKYLSDEQLVQMAKISRQAKPSQRAHNATLTRLLSGGKSTDTGANFTMFGGMACNNMSFASRKYMERHGLMDGLAASTTPSTRLHVLPESPDEITILRDIHALKVPSLDWHVDDVPEREHPPVRPASRPEPCGRYEPATYSGSNSMFASHGYHQHPQTQQQKAIVLPQHSVTESSHCRRITSWCRQVAPAHSSCLLDGDTGAAAADSCSTCISVSECSEIGHWPCGNQASSYNDSTLCCSGLEGCDQKQFESTPANAKYEQRQRDGAQSRGATRRSGSPVDTASVSSQPPTRSSTSTNTSSASSASSVSSASSATAVSRPSQDQLVKDGGGDYVRVFDMSAKQMKMQPLPPASTSFLNPRPETHDSSASDNILDIQRLKKLPKLL